MRKFEFRLERIRRYRETLEKEKKREMAEAASIVKREKDLLAALRKEEVEGRKSLREALKDMRDPAEIACIERFIENLYGMIEAQQERVTQAERHLEQKQHELIEASKACKTLSRLYEKCYEGYLYEITREEQRFLDDVATGRFVRRKHELEGCG